MDLLRSFIRQTRKIKKRRRNVAVQAEGRLKFLSVPTDAREVAVPAIARRAEGRLTG